MKTPVAMFTMTEMMEAKRKHNLKPISVPTEALWALAINQCPDNLNYFRNAHGAT